jgi:hypothetical protein
VKTGDLLAVIDPRLSRQLWIRRSQKKRRTKRNSPTPKSRWHATLIC